MNGHDTNNINDTLNETPAEGHTPLTPECQVQVEDPTSAVKLPDSNFGLAITEAQAPQSDVLLTLTAGAS